MPLAFKGISKMCSKVPIASLPIPKPTHLLTHNLTPDTHTPSVAVLRNEVLTKGPTIQRRSRLLAPQSHFSYVSPLPLPFPYDLQPIEAPIKAEDIERWLAEREAVHKRPLDNGSEPGSPSGGEVELEMYYPKNRDQPRVLIGLAETGLNDCVPHLDVGDAFETLGAPSFFPSPDTSKSGGETFEAVRARQDLVDVLSGHAVLMSPEKSKVHFAPWSLRYSGHQFGVWAGQLGDGRAISVLTTPHPSNPDITYELQLKGAGRTPFSRTADGLAVLRSSIREFLCSEAMHALSIPTTRSLSLISLPSLPVIRERVEKACILTRVAPSFLRIGNFEALSPPAQVFYLGGGQQPAHWDALRILGEWVVKRVLRLEIEEGKAWGKELVLEVARRNARMVAGWQAFGFMHGVINTDNVSILGLTIDYGPYAFMDIFDSDHICNHTDEEGRYAYRYQPSMIIYALRSLLNSLAPLIGAELARGGKAVSPGWAEDASQSTLQEWRLNGVEAVKDGLERIAEEECAVEYGRLMHKRLGLRRTDASDEAQLMRPMLKIMEDHKLDFHKTFRSLCNFRPVLLKDRDALNVFIDELLTFALDPLDRREASKEWSAWLETYAARIENERDMWAGESDVDQAREVEMSAVNPRFVLRQWLLEEIIKIVEGDHDTGKRVLRKVLRMACDPFKPWGAEGDKTPGPDLEAELREERRYCGMGTKNMLGFQCSCSS